MHQPVARNVFKGRAMELYPVIAFLKGIDADGYAA
jgi:hypothetical protein